MIKEAVTIIIPALNEEASIARAMRSLIHGGYPAELLQFVIVDGGSVDDTLSVVREVAEQTGVSIQVLRNPQKVTPVSLNIAVNAATTRIVLRADAHAIYSKNYILNSVTALIAGDGDNIGGRVISVASETNFSAALAKVLNSVFGNGGASYRNSGKPAYVETVWCGCWFRKTLLDIGLFNETCITNQDAELNARLVRNGYRVRYDPSISAELIVRGSYQEMLRQYFNYGIGRSRTVRLHPSSLKLRQVFPIVLTLLLLMSGLIFPALFLLFTCFIFMVWLTEKYYSLPHFHWFIPIVVGMNVSWAAGFLKYYFKTSIFRPNSLKL